MRSFSDAQTLSDRTEEQERYSDGQARPGAVGVRGEGDLCGTWSVRVSSSTCPSRTTPFTERHALRLEL